MLSHTLSCSSEHLPAFARLGFDRISIGRFINHSQKYFKLAGYSQAEIPNSQSESLHRFIFNQRIAQGFAAFDKFLRHDAAEVADAADIGGALGHGNGAARIKHIESVAALSTCS